MVDADESDSACDDVSETPGVQELVFLNLQAIQQQAGESSVILHERLRPIVRNSFQVLEKETKITTHSWYTCDVSELLGIPNAVAVCTSTCKHETPLQILVGIREIETWQKELPSRSGQDKQFVYRLLPLGRQLTDDEKDAIYDKM